MPSVLYEPMIINSSKENAYTNIIGTVTDFTDISEYTKTKAQRLFAKIPTLDKNEENTISKTSSSANLTATKEDPTSIVSKTNRRKFRKSIKKLEDIYIHSLTKALHDLFTRSNYDNDKLQKIHEELIASGHISPLNEFYRSPTEALRVILDHCVTYTDLIKWTLSVLETTNKPNLMEFGHDLYSIAINLDLELIQHIDNKRCAIEIQERLKHGLQTFIENDLRGMLKPFIFFIHIYCNFYRN